MTASVNLGKDAAPTDSAKAAKSGPMLAADGTPLKTSLNRALRREKLRALALISPLLVFIVLSFVAPIVDMLFRSVENEIVVETLPRTVPALADWDATVEPMPGEEVFAELYADLVVAVAFKNQSRLGTRLNYEEVGVSSLFRSIGRRMERFPTEDLVAGYVAVDPAYGDPASWAAWMADDAVREALPLTTRDWDDWVRIVVEEEEEDPAAYEVHPFIYTALTRDLKAGAVPPVMPAVDVSELPTFSVRDAFLAADEDWGDEGLWRVILTYSPRYTDGYFLNAIDMQNGVEGAEWRDENQQIYLTLFVRTMWMSIAITVSCILLGYPIAWLIASLPARRANMLLILVLLPFWTSLLVRTSAWKVLLQTQGVINDTLVWWHSTWLGWALDPLFTGICNIVIAVLKLLAFVYNLIFTNIFGAETMMVLDWAGLGFERLQLINNVTGTIISMTHILLPFMILPLYSVLKTIPPSYLRAAKSLGATDWTAFWRVYFPQSIPGIGAGSILVFILAIGYYITPEIVGGTKGVFISNRIAYHISESLNWGLAAALGAILLVMVMGLYWAYDRIVGIDNVKLGG